MIKPSRSECLECLSEGSCRGDDHSHIKPLQRYVVLQTGFRAVLLRICESMTRPEETQMKDA
jgi:hypothetical protein